MGAAQAKEAVLETPQGSPVNMPPGFMPPAAAAFVKQQGVSAETFDTDTASPASCVEGLGTCLCTGETSSRRLFATTLPSQV